MPETPCHNRFIGLLPGQQEIIEIIKKIFRRIIVKEIGIVTDAVDIPGNYHVIGSAVKGYRYAQEQWIKYPNA
jgi:hypothetical protein